MPIAGLIYVALGIIFHSGTAWAVGGSSWVSSRSRGLRSANHEAQSE
jgi:hypothetical protein